MPSLSEVRHVEEDVVAHVYRERSFVADRLAPTRSVIVFPNGKICRPTMGHGGIANIEMEQSVESLGHGGGAPGCQDRGDGVRYIFQTWKIYDRACFFVFRRKFGGL